MEFFLIIIIIVLAYLLYKSKTNQNVNISENTKKFGFALKQAASTFQDSLNKNSSIYKSYVLEILEFIETHNVATQGLILRNAVRYKDDICDEDSDNFGISHYFKNYSREEMKQFFSNPSELDKDRAIEILESYKEAYVEGKKKISKMPKGANTQLGSYEFIGFSMWFASSSGIIYEELFSDSLNIWKILYPLAEEEGVDKTHIPDFYIQKLK